MIKEIEIHEGKMSDYCTACSVVNFESYEGTVINLYVGGAMVQLCGSCVDIMVRKIKAYHALKGEEE